MACATISRREVRATSWRSAGSAALPFVFGDFKASEEVHFRMASDWRRGDGEGDERENGDCEMHVDQILGGLYVE